MNTKTVVSSKWIKTKVLANSEFLNAHIPKTLQLSQGSLAELLNRYGMVYIKPDTGSCGVGVMRIDHLKPSGKWVVQAGTARSTFASFKEMYRWLSKHVDGIDYLVQQGIHVLKLEGRPIDFRVMIQQGRKDGWKVTGTAARVAHPLKAVTNGSQGGSIYGAGSLLRRIAGPRQATRLSQKFNRLAHLTAQRFAQAYPRMRELGLDIAVDREHRTWIIEVNTRPDPCPFTKLDDSSMLRDIVRHAKEYGRTYNLSCGKAKRGEGAPGA